MIDITAALQIQIDEINIKQNLQAVRHDVAQAKFVENSPDSCITNLRVLINTLLFKVMISFS